MDTEQLVKVEKADDKNLILSVLYNGKREQVIFKDLSWGESNDCVRQAIIFDPITQTEKLERVTAMEIEFAISIIAAPFPTNLESVRKLPRRLCNSMQTEFRKWNGGDISFRGAAKDTEGGKAQQ